MNIEQQYRHLLKEVNQEINLLLVECSVSINEDDLAELDQGQNRNLNIVGHDQETMGKAFAEQFG